MLTLGSFVAAPLMSTDHFTDPSRVSIACATNFIGPELPDS